MTEALSHLKVLDVTHQIAGPYCTKLLADLGAEVIKIEKPGEGDVTRRLGPFPNDLPHPEKSGLFLYLNTNKKSITLNLKTVQGKQIFKDLVKDTDVLVENFEPRVMSDLGLNYEILEQINPKLVMTSISNFGQTGPYRDYKATELNLAALGGPMYLTGNLEREPLKEPGSVFQFAAGADGCTATLAATLYQARSGIGQHIDLSIMETVVACMAHHPISWGRSRITTKRRGPYGLASAWPNPIAHSGIYPCKDGHVLVAVHNQEGLTMLAPLTGHEEITDESRFRCLGFGKIIGADELSKILLDSLKDRNKEELFHSAQELRLFWTSVKTIEDVFKWDQYKERKFWVDIDHPIAGKLTYARTPFLLKGSPARFGRAPLLGEHNEEIYREHLGFTKEEMVQLTSNNII